MFLFYNDRLFASPVPTDRRASRLPEVDDDIWVCLKLCVRL